MANEADQFMNFQDCEGREKIVKIKSSLNSETKNRIMIITDMTISDKLEKVTRKIHLQDLFVTGITHDLRAPVSSILYILDDIQGSLAPPQRQKAIVAKSSCQMLTFLINDIMVYIFVYIYIIYRIIQVLKKETLNF